MTAERLKF